MDEASYNKALKFLARRPRSEKEMRDYLLRKNKKFLQKKRDSESFNSEKRQTEIKNKIESIISKLKEQKFINDYEFAQWWIEQRKRFRPKGWRVLEFELRQKGILSETVKELKARDQESGEESEKELLKKLTQRHIKKYQGLPKQEIYNKLGGFLARRGFDLGTIKTYIDEILGK